MTQRAELRKALLEAVDHGLQVPGEIVRAAIYDRIEKSYGLKREEIPERLEAFHNALEDLLGRSAKVMERVIAKSLYSRLELNFTAHDSWTLVDYVDHAERSEVNDPRDGR